MPSDHEVPVKNGDVLDGKYRVERVLGMGGMGVVVAARHTTLNQRVALKFMLPEAARDPESVARFEREARAAVKLKSEHTARVTDIGKLDSGAPYMVMEFLTGRDLGDLISQGGSLRIGDAVEYALQACEALAEAHASGIVHRDIKPRNLYLTAKVDGAPLIKVLDFGLAKQIDQLGGERGLTRTNAVMGSPQYMSPEQMRASREVDGRTDIWSLGVCLYELLTGKVPFDAETVPLLCVMVMKEEPEPPSKLRGDIPPGLSDAVMRCLQKNPVDRFSNVAELAAALEPFGPERTTGSAVRVRQVLSSTRLNVESEAPHAMEGAPTFPALATSETRTASTFDAKPSNVAKPRNRAAWMGAAVGCVVGVVGFSALLYARLPGARPASAGNDNSESGPLPTPTVSRVASAPSSAMLTAPATAPATAQATVDAGAFVAATDPTTPAPKPPTTMRRAPPTKHPAAAATPAPPPAVVVTPQPVPPPTVAPPKHTGGSSNF